jgi:hypothetical protein
MQNVDRNIDVSKKNAIFRRKCRKSHKIVIIASTPDWTLLRNCSWPRQERRRNPASDEHGEAAEDAAHAAEPGADPTTAQFTALGRFVPGRYVPGQFVPRALKNDPT